MDVLREVLRTKGKTFIWDFMVNHPVTEHGDNTYEVSPTLIALSATAVCVCLVHLCDYSPCCKVHAALVDSRVKGSRPLDFSAELYSGIFETHKSILAGLLKQNANAYHALLRRFFESVE